MAIFTTSAQAQKVWSRGTSNGTFNWTDSANWTGGSVPSTTETAPVYITYAAGSNSTLRFDTGGDQTFQGGLYVTSNSSIISHMTLDLQGNKLIFDGGSLTLAAEGNAGTAVDSTRWTFSNGTIQIGTDANAASWIFGTDVLPNTISTASNNTRVFTALFTSDTVVDTANMTNLEIAAPEGGRSKNFALDLTAATIRSGENAGVFSMSGSMKIGFSNNQTANAGSVRIGTLKLGLVNTVSIGEDLILGQGERPTPPGNSTVSIPKQGTLEFSAAQTTAVALNVGRDVRIGVGDRSTGSITNRPATLDVTIGSASTAAEDRGVFYVGYKNQSQGPDETTRDSDTSGNFSGGTAGGSLNAWVRELRVGQNTQTAGSGVGVLDFRNSTLGTFAITNDAIIGAGVNAAGSVYLKGGSANSSTLLIGDATGSTRSLLSLDGTSWSVSDTLLVGALGDIDLIVTTNVINLDLGSDALGAFTIEDDGVIRATFDEAITGPLWAIRQLGDQRSTFADLVEQEKLIALGSYSTQAGIHFDGTYTYYGVTPIPEPSTLLLLGGAGAFMLLYRRTGSFSRKSTQL